MFGQVSSLRSVAITLPAHNTVNFCVVESLEIIYDKAFDQGRSKEVGFDTLTIVPISKLSGESLVNRSP